jgi:hypothetical protein
MAGMNGKKRWDYENLASPLQVQTVGAQVQVVVITVQTVREVAAVTTAQLQTWSTSCLHLTDHHHTRHSSWCVPRPIPPLPGQLCSLCILVWWQAPIKKVGLWGRWQPDCCPSLCVAQHEAVYIAAGRSFAKNPSFRWTELKVTCSTFALVCSADTSWNVCKQWH